MFFPGDRHVFSETDMFFSEITMLLFPKIALFFPEIAIFYRRLSYFFHLFKYARNIKKKILIKNKFLFSYDFNATVKKKVRKLLFNSKYRNSVRP